MNKNIMIEKFEASCKINTDLENDDDNESDFD